MTRLVMLHPAADSYGRSYRPGQSYPFPAGEARRLVAAGAARMEVQSSSARPSRGAELEAALNVLRRHGAGVAIGPDTDPRVRDAAEALRVPVARDRGRRAAEWIRRFTGSRSSGPGAPEAD